MKKSLEKRIEELEEEIKKLKPQKTDTGDWITIDYSVIPKETFDRYGAKPFQIMKKKMRDDNGKVWNNISWPESKKEAEKRGFRLPHITEMLVLLDEYKKKHPKDASVYHDEFLGIEELSFKEDVAYEQVDGPSPVVRGASWYSGSSAGAFALYLGWGTGDTGSDVGFRCARSA